MQRIQRLQRIVKTFGAKGILPVMESKFNRSLSKKALIGIVFILLPVVITFFLSFHKNRWHIKELIFNDITAIAEAYEGHVYQFLEISKRRVQDFASDGFIRHQLLKINRSRDKRIATMSLNKYLAKDKIILDKSIKTIHVLSPEGRVVASTNIPEIGMDLSNEAFFIKGSDVIKVVECYFGYTKQPGIAISAPIFSKVMRRPIGVIVNYIQLSEINKVLAGESIRELGAISWNRGRAKSMEVYLVNQEKRMITESRFVKNAVLKQVVNTLPVELSLTSQKEMVGLYKDYRDREVAGASMYIPSLKWVLLVEVDKNDVMAPLKYMLVNAMITVYIVIALIFTLFVIFVKRVVQPLRIISDAAKDIASGNYDVVIPVQTRDEIGMLCNSFNNMSHDIKTRTLLLTRSDARLAEAQRIAHIGSWEWDIVKNELCWSDEIYRIFGLSPREFNATYEAFLDCVHPDDREFVKKSINEALYKNTYYDIDHRILLKDGTVRIVYAKGEIFIDDTGRAIRMVGTVQDITERKRMEDQMRKLSYAIEQSTIAIVITDTNGNIQYVNPKFTQLTGYTSEEVMGKNPCILKSGKTPPEVYTRLWNTITAGGEWQGEFCNKKKNGEFYWEQERVSSIKNQEEVITNFIAFKEDITLVKQAEEEQTKLRERLERASRLESIGKLAGGIAHDFNNILTVIIGYGNLLNKETKKGNPSMEYVKKILTSAERAAQLTQGLLAFSRKQIINQRPVNVNEFVKKSESLLSRLIGEDIELKTILMNRDGIVMADSGQMEQVLMNLTTNARDAMPEGGDIIIRTEIVELGNEYIKAHGYGLIGKYVLLSFSDTGVGMDEETKKRIFEPFFTTKKVGKGTGLGLAIVYGIVKQHNGYINVYSETDKGTTLKIYLPLVESMADKLKPDTSAPVTLDGTETILLAEDEEEVRTLGKKVLERFGYKAIEAADGEEAIQKFMENKDDINLLVFDVLMPKKSGKEAYDAIRKIRPDMKVLFMSGYSEDIIHKKGIPFKGGLNFVSKPISPKRFLVRVRMVLDNALSATYKLPEKYLENKEKSQVNVIS